jgi:hypothetical protein
MLIRLREAPENPKVPGHVSFGNFPQNYVILSLARVKAMIPVMDALDREHMGEREFAEEQIAKAMTSSPHTAFHGLCSCGSKKEYLQCCGRAQK